MPKKSKVNKLARMSDEERARYLQHRADIEEEARRRKRELIARFIKNKLDKEEAYSRKNTAKLNQMWRYVLRKIKCKQMGLEIQGMMNSFNYLLERKNRLIKSLTNGIDDSDDQHRRAFQAQTETISDFICIGSQRLDKLQEEYEKQKNILLENWEREEMDIGDNQDRAEFKLKLIIYIQETGFKNYNKEKEMERATNINDARLEHEEDMNAFRGPKQFELEYYWARLREVYSSYLDQHNPIMGHYQLLKEKDEFYQKDIAKNELLIRQATKLVLTLQKEYMRTESVMSQKIKRMNEHKEDLSRRYWQMKKESKLQRNKDGEQLAVLVDASHDVIEKLEEAEKKLDKISQLAEICSKYEKEDDYDIARYNYENEDRVGLYEHLDEAMMRECKEYNKLDKFLLKMNHVNVQTMCLKTEKSKLMKENAQLKNYIKRYLTELALNNEKERPFSVRVQSVHKHPAIAKINRPVTCIEGALSNAVMHEKRMKTFERKTRETGVVRAYPRLQNWMEAS